MRLDVRAPECRTVEVPRVATATRQNRLFNVNSRLSGLATAVGGIVWIAHATVRLSGSTYWAPQSVLDWASVVTFSLALFGLVPALTAVWTQQKGRGGRPNALGFWLAVCAALAAGVGNFVEDGLGLSVVGLAIYLPASLVLPIGLLIFGIATARSNLVPAWCGWLIVLMVVGLFLVDIGGGFIVGAVCLMLAVFLLRSNDPGRRAVRRDEVDQS